MDYKAKYKKYKKKYLYLTSQAKKDSLYEHNLKGGNYSCHSEKSFVISNKLEDFCYPDRGGKYKTLEDCAFSEECILTNIRKHEVHREQRRIVEYEQKIKERLGIDRENTNIDKNLSHILSEILKKDRILILGEQHKDTPLLLTSIIFDILKTLGFTHFL